MNARRSSTVFEKIHTGTLARGDADYLVLPDGRSINCRELLSLSAGLRGKVSAVAKDIRGNAGIMLKDPALYIPALIALWSLGKGAAVLDPSATDQKLRKLIEVAEIGFILEDLGDCAGASDIARISISRADSSLYGDLYGVENAIEDHVPAIFLFTSGSTGTPKCVPLSLSNIESNIDDFYGKIGVGASDCILSSSPVFYAHGLYNCLLSSLFLGAKSVYNGVLNLMNAENLISLANRFPGSVYHCTPQMMQILLLISGKTRQTLPKFKHVICGTNRLEPGLKSRFEKAFDCVVTQQYGMTETLFISVNLEKQIRAPESVGIPVACEIRIFDDFGNPLPQGAQGEIGVKSLSCFGSYYRQPEESAKSFRDGWFITGDRGCIDEDGYLSIVGRSKEIIKKGGFNINPHEISEVIMKDPRVMDTATISMPDRLYGEEIYSLFSGTAREEELMSLCRSSLPLSHIPKRILRLDKIPKTSTGKTALDELRKACAEILAGDENPASSKAVVNASAETKSGMGLN